MPDDIRPESNPYAVTLDLEANQKLNALPAPLEQVSFSGTVDVRHIKEYVRERASFGCSFVGLTLLAIFFVAICVSFFGPGPGIGIGCITSMLLLYYRLPGSVNRRARSLLAARPWLSGEVEGVMSGSNLTVHYRNITIQTNRRLQMMPIANRMVISEVEGKPIVLIPSMCFYMNDWLIMQDGMSKARHLPLIIEQPPDDAILHQLPVLKNDWLDSQYEASKGKPSFYGLSLVAIIVLVIMMFPAAAIFSGMNSVWQISIWLVASMVGWIVIEFGWKLYVRRNLRNRFRAGAEQYRPFETSSSGMVYSWLNPTACLLSTQTYWILAKGNEVDRVECGTYVLDIYLGNLRLRFHREGFESETDWKKACRCALENFGKNRVPSTNLP